VRGNALASLAVGAVLAACSGGELTVVVALPPDADRLAILAESSNGNLRFASPIREITAGATRVEIPEASTDGAVVFALAWRSSDLGALPIGVVPVRRASALDPVLPPPMFAARGPSVDGQALLQPILDPAEYPPVTIDNLDTCPRRVIEDVAVDTRCGAYPCEATLRQNGCALELDAETCLLGTLTGRIDAKGMATLDRSSGFGPCTEIGASDPDVVIGLECARGGSNACHIDLVSLTHVDEPFGEATLLNLTPTAPGAPPPIKPLLPGELTAIVATSDRILVAGIPGAPADPFCRNAPSTIWVIDPIAMTLVRTATAPRCLTLMAPDPGFGGFIGVYGGEGRQRLGRWTNDGQLVQSVVLTSTTQTVTRLVTSLDPPRVYLALGTGHDDEAQVIALSYARFEPLWASQPKGKTFTDLQVLGADKVVVVDAEKGDVLQFEMGVLALIAPFNIACGIMSADPLRLLPLSEPERWVVTAFGDSAEILVLTQNARSACEAASSYAVEGEPWAIVRAPDPDREDALVGMQSRSGDAVVARYDARGGRFLPKKVPLGARGPISEMVVLGDAVFGLLPTEGSIFRVTPN